MTLSTPGTHPAVLRELVAHSISLIEREQADSGAYPACSTFSVYRYAWLRDGSFVADAMSRHGRRDSPTAFHEWVHGVVTARADRIDAVVAAAESGEQVDPASCLPTRYTLDGQEGPSGWWDFQLDGYGTWLWALARHLAYQPERRQVEAARYRASVELIVRYLCALWRQPCYDWWEEHDEHVHVSTLTSIWAGLAAAQRTDLLSPGTAALAARTTELIAQCVATDGSVDGRLRKWLGSDAVDGSLLSAIAPFEVVSDPVAAATLAVVEADIVEDRGVHRFRADVFYGGGRWPVLAGFLGEAYLRLDRRADAAAQLAWIAGTADQNGDLPEQVTDQLLAPDAYPAWVDRWGSVARPLLWSHAGYLSLAARLGVTA